VTNRARRRQVASRLGLLPPPETPVADEPRKPTGDAEGGPRPMVPSSAGSPSAVMNRAIRSARSRSTEVSLDFGE
jgi:hypothetical protein